MIVGAGRPSSANASPATMPSTPSRATTRVTLFAVLVAKKLTEWFRWEEVGREGRGGRLVGQPPASVSVRYYGLCSRNRGRSGYDEALSVQLTVAPWQLFWL